ELHPAQRALIDCHGSQCGFCTPGFVMSLFALYKNAAAPTRRDIDDALAGNLCRCTGYQPIIDAARTMYDGPADGGSWTAAPAGGDVSEDEQRRITQLATLESDSPLCIEHEGRRFYAPRDIVDLAGLVEQYPGATILAGGTDVGLWVTKQQRRLEVVIYTGKVATLQDISVSDGRIDIGAAASLTDVMPVLSEHFPSLDELFLRFASPPIRNAGTLGGNVANGSPIGDSMPALLVLGTTLVLRKGTRTRELLLDDFYLSYQKTALQPGEFVERILIPLPTGIEKIASYKLSKRFDQDISAVCGAYRLIVDSGKVTDIRIAYGGMAEVPKRATAAESALIGTTWNEDALIAAGSALAEDFVPISDMRSSASYRVQACSNLLRRFHLETSGIQVERVYNYGR
ncbi:MAG: xanthine dehydrogenase small subunit, partial [Gammaproteobacteria bacterium]|nr:xanthine dehydrogenase small subunit [Gammaproteobacteria bacterium]